MIEALWDFFGLYKAGSDYLPGFWLTMLLLYLNAGLYLADLYHLVKRKSKAETVSLMAIPGIFAILLVSVASFLLCFFIRFYGESGSGVSGSTSMAAANAGRCPVFRIILHGLYWCVV